MGWDVIRHSFAMLFRNLGNALRISVGPTLIGVAGYFLIIYVFGRPDGFVAESEHGQLPPDFFIGMFILGLLFVFLFAWIAVAWHRFILLEDYPGLLPSLAGRTVWRYIATAFILIFVILVVAIPAMIVVGLFASVLMGPVSKPILVTLMLGLYVYGSYMWLRFAIVLPATAIARPMRLGEAWRATAPYGNAILGTTVIVILVNGVISSVGSLFPGPLAVIISLAANWISIMLGISVLTTLYGVIIERRDLT